MTRNERNHFLTILSAQHDELTRTTGRRDGIAIERTADALDETQFAAQRELTTRSLERESQLLRDVRAAMGRIADGSYGTCLECEEDISHKRLNAVPWAKLCISCQQAADRNPRHGFEPQEFLPKAA